MSEGKWTEWRNFSCGTIECPRCGESVDNPFVDDECVLDDGEHDVDCDECGAAFVVQAEVQFRFRGVA